MWLQILAHMCHFHRQISFPHAKSPGRPTDQERLLSQRHRDSVKAPDLQVQGGGVDGLKALDHWQQAPEAHQARGQPGFIRVFAEEAFDLPGLKKKKGVQFSHSIQFRVNHNCHI